MSTSADYDFYDAMVNYKREEYSVAIQKWEILLSEKPHNDTLNYFLGVSYLAQGNAEKASLLLSEATEDNASIFIDDAYYYSALAEIKRGNNESAIELLGKSKSQKSLSLLNELK
jgi:tetratricopeptide (TPR) repeat protein